MSDLSVVVKPFDALLADWLQLDQNLLNHPFRGLGWHEALHREASPETGLEAVVVKRGDQVVAAATLGFRSVRRCRVIRSRMYFLNETGHPVMDRLTLEHNGLSSHPEDEARAFRALAQSLLRDNHWDEWSLGWMDEAHWKTLEPAFEGLPLQPRSVECQPFYYVDLVNMASLDDVLAGMSSNTRYQVRRAIRAYGGQEAVRLEAAQDPSQALTWFEEMVALHQAYWQSRGRPGAFAEDFMRRFHRRLISTGLAKGQVQLLRVTAGKGLVGYLYNLRAGSHVYNYQSGLVYDDDAKRKPGLVCHALAMAHCAALGLHRYDLLMGDSQYKRSLANGSGTMLRIHLQRPRWRFRLEDGLRRLRQRR